jgi:hypothetical protein
MKTLYTFLVMGMTFLPQILAAQKPFHQWEKKDILTFIENNDIDYEGTLFQRENHQEILIGKGVSENENIHYNFYLKEGFLIKTLITVSQINAFQLVNHQVELNGFQKLSESSDALGNRYRKYTDENIEIIVINKTADWPVVYYHP